MRIEIIVTILAMFILGCELFEEKCDDYCDGNIKRNCTNDGGLFGGHNDWMYHDCEDDDMICVEINHYPKCVYSSKECDFNNDSFCKNGKIFTCLENDGEFSASYKLACNAEDNEVCVEFPGYAVCVIPIEECNPKAEKTCINNKIGLCYENNGNFYAKYSEDCEEKECVELGNEKIYCLTPVEECSPSEDDICLNNQIGQCYKKDGKFYISSKYDCENTNRVCLELENNEVECFTPIDECDPDNESICVDNAVSKCFSYDGNYFLDIISYCYSDECIYDPETKKAECLSNSE